jgi:rod shape-determining protein MreD
MLVLGFLVLGILLIVLQTTLLQFLPSWFDRPDLVYILVAFIAYRFDWVRGFFLVFLLGWMMDIVSGIYLGTYPLLYFFVFVSLKILSENSPMKETAYQIPLVGVSYFLVQMALYSIYSLTLPDTIPEWSWARVIVVTIVLVVATIPCFLLYNSFFEYFQKKRLSPKILKKKSSNQFRKKS